MNVWLLKTGERIAELDGSNSRPFRTGIMAKYFASAGHQVRWWSSNYSHQQKRYIVEGEKEIQIGERIIVEALHGMPYQKNFSLSRFINHRQLASSFSRNAPLREKPDVIICSYPTIDYSLAAIEYGAKMRVPVFIDIRDMWPDIFPYYAPHGLRKVMRFLLRGSFAKSREVMARATGLVGITQGFLDWALMGAGRCQSARDMVVHLGSPDAGMVSHWSDSSLCQLTKIGCDRDDVLTICFIGSLGLVLDLETVLLGCNILRGRGIRFRLIVAGDGERLGYYRRRYGGFDDVVFTGWLDRVGIQSVLKISDIGVNPMPERFDFLATINNKAVEYMGSGLPIVMCPARGSLFDLVAVNHIGLAYQSGDPSSFADVIDRLSSRREQVKLMGKRSRSLYEKLFETGSVYRRFVTRIEQLAEEWVRSEAAQSGFGGTISS